MVKKSQADADDLQTPDIGDSDPAWSAVEVITHMLLVKHKNTSLLHVAGHVPVGVLDSELALLSTNKSFTTPENSEQACLETQEVIDVD